jgi:FHS family Na+ dependent glucose MFS transporter 1
MNGMHFCWGLGSFLSPLVIAQAVRMSGSITWAYWVLALLVVPAAVWLLRVPSPAAQSASKQESEALPQSASSEKLLVGLIALLLFLYAGAEASFGGWIFTYATDLNLADETAAALLTSAYWGALTLGRLLAIPIAARVHPRPILFLALGGCLASVGVILLWPASHTALWLGAFGLGLSMATIFPTAISFAGHHLAITGQITGWFFVGASAGGMSLPWIIGQLFEAQGPRAMMVSILADLALAMGVLIVLTWHSKRR